MISLIESRLNENCKYICLWKVENEYYVTIQEKDTLTEFGKAFEDVDPYDSLEAAFNVYMNRPYSYNFFKCVAENAMSLLYQNENDECVQIFNEILENTGMDCPDVEYFVGEDFRPWCDEDIDALEKGLSELDELLFV